MPSIGINIIKRTTMYASIIPHLTLSQLALILQIIGFPLMAADYWLSSENLEKVNNWLAPSKEPLKHRLAIKYSIQSTYQSLPYFISIILAGFILVSISKYIESKLGIPNVISALLFVGWVVTLVLVSIRHIAGNLVVLYHSFTAVHNFFRRAKKGAIFGVGALCVTGSLVLKTIIEFNLA